MRRMMFPLLLLSVAALAVVLTASGAGLSALPLIATVLGLAVVTLAERRWPRVGASAESGETRADLGYAAMTAATDAITGAAIASLAVVVGSYLPFGFASELSLVTAVPLVLLVSAFGDYWAHRASHEWRWWWKLHAAHHAPHRMHALNNLRLHPLDLLLKNLASLLPVLILGVCPDALAIALGIKGINVAAQHADLDLRHGWFNYVFATNSVHRWHHSTKEEEGNANYGGVLVLFDQLFGSFYLPPEADDPDQLGLFDEQNYPVHGVWRATVAPLCWRRCTEKGA